MRRQNLSTEEFACLWELKKDDYRYHCIPDDQLDEPKKLAKKYGPLCLAALGAGRGIAMPLPATPPEPNEFSRALDAMGADVGEILHGRKPFPAVGSGNEDDDGDAARVPGAHAGGAQG